MKVQFIEREHMVDGGCWAVVHDNGHIVAEMNTFGRNKTAEAHARRMAASDKLLDALTALRDFVAVGRRTGRIPADVPGHILTMLLLAQATDAIAQAKGAE